MTTIHELICEAIEEKWKPMLDGDVADYGEDNCVLCQEFDCCVGCPVALESGQRLCKGTPYTAWAAHKNDGDCPESYSWRAECPECYELIEAELDYLERLAVKYANQ
jgi:hypothetical protein